jgi:hypothetical protein
VLEADGAGVIVVRGYGVQLRGAPTDVGLTLGYARRTYIYPETTPTCLVPDGTTSGCRNPRWHRLPGTAKPPGSTFGSRARLSG